MKKEPLDIYLAPVIQIDIAIPTLEREGIRYAHIVVGASEFGRKYEFRERLGINMQQYIGKTVECILEVIEADFFNPKSKEERKKLAEDIEKGEYVWTNSGDKFIPELVDMVEGHHDEEDYEYDEDEFERLGVDYLKNWGVCGFGLGLYDDKPMVKTEEGVFLFNEYRNEELIEEWELGDIIYFRPTQMLLRGMKVVERKDWRKNKKEEIIAKEYETVIVGRPRIIDPW